LALLISASKRFCKLKLLFNWTYLGLTNFTEETSN
jgi:hypothetical protein